MNQNEIIQSRFSKPEGFNGIHKFKIPQLGKTRIEIQHSIDMRTAGKESIIWPIAIRSLHNAIIEDYWTK